MLMVCQSVITLAAAAADALWMCGSVGIVTTIASGSEHFSKPSELAFCVDAQRQTQQLVITDSGRNCLLTVDLQTGITTQVNITVLWPTLSWWVISVVRCCETVRWFGRSGPHQFKRQIQPIPSSGCCVFRCKRWWQCDMH